MNGFETAKGRLERAERTKWLIDWQYLCLPIKRIRTVCEVGIGPIEISAIPYFNETNCERLIGIDPNPVFCEAVREGCPFADVFQFAVGATPGKANLLLNGGSSFIEGGWSPTPAPDGAGRIEVDVAPFSDFDDGKIDILNLDCEGAEWDVLSAMESSPALIGIELWRGHPKREECLNWLKSRGYFAIVTTGPEGETMVFWRQDR